jgi:hypothetical protein
MPCDGGPYGDDGCIRGGSVRSEKGAGVSDECVWRVSGGSRRSRACCDDGSLRERSRSEEVLLK